MMNIYSEDLTEKRRLPISSEITLNHGYENHGFISSISDSLNESSVNNSDKPTHPVPKKISEITATSLSSAYHNPFSHHVYEDIRFEDESVTSSVPGSPMTERSFARSHSTKSKASTHGTFTRQLNMFIGEEWENVQQNNLNFQRKAFSCPSSPRTKRSLTITKQPEVANAAGDSDIPPSDANQRSHDPLGYFFYHMSQEPPTPKDYGLKPNPHNKINHMIHSALHCPCFLFFCFLCCLPGVYYMLKGDRNYKRGNESKAIKYGKRSTVFYIIGTIFGILLLGSAVFFAVRFVQEQVT